MGDFVLHRTGRPSHSRTHHGRAHTDVSATYSKTYRPTHFSETRQRFSSHGYRIAINAESTVTAAFTGSLTNTSTTLPIPPLFQAYIRYYNVQLSTHKHVLATTSMTLPYSGLPGPTGGPDHYVPIPLSGSVSLAPGIYQFDVFVAPSAAVPTAVLSDSDSDSACSGSDSDGSGGSHLPVTSVPFTADGSGTLSIQVVRKTL